LGHSAKPESLAGWQIWAGRSIRFTRQVMLPFLFSEITGHIGAGTIDQSRKRDDCMGCLSHLLVAAGGDRDQLAAIGTESNCQRLLLHPRDLPCSCGLENSYRSVQTGRCREIAVGTKGDGDDPRLMIQSPQFAASSKVENSRRSVRATAQDVPSVLAES
jgi:hypothetical protein